MSASFPDPLPLAAHSPMPRLLEILERAAASGSVSREVLAEANTLARRAADEETRTAHRSRFLEDSVARSLQEIEEKILELSVLKRIGDVVASAIRRPDLLEQALDILVQEFKADNSSIMLLDAATGELTVWAGRGRNDDPKAPREAPSAIRLGEGIAGWVASRREALLIHDVSQDVRFMRRDENRSVRGSLVCIPLLGDGRVLGVLNLSTSEPGVFGAHHTRVLRIVANQIASALLGAELHRELQSFSGRLESEVVERTKELERRTEDLRRKNDQITDLYFSLERAQRELEERNVSLVEALTFNDNIVESLHVGIGVVRPDGRVINWNRAMGALTRGLLEKEQILGRLVSEIPEDVRERFALGAALGAALRFGTPYSERGRIVHTAEGDEIHLNVRHIPVAISGEGDLHVIVVLEDVTDAANLHFARVKAERLAAINETMVSVNHEVNNPLAVILAYAQILLRRLDAEPRAEEALPRARIELGRIESESLRIREITQKLASLVEPVVTAYPASDGVKMVDLGQSR